MRDRFGEAWDLLFAPPIAHRGLWSPDGPPENSLAAFEAACEAGYGIELDVQLAADGEAVVFHDYDLARLTGEAGLLAARTSTELAQLRLGPTAEPIPTLRQVLEQVGRRAMIHIELKTLPGAEGPLEQRVFDLISDHAGPVAVIGFNPASHAWFAERHPHVLRGLDSYSYAGSPLPEETRRAYAALEHVAIARPHFLALGLDMLPSEIATRHRQQGLPLIAWTIRDAAQWSAIKNDCDNLIFEGFRA
ncbi:glycerophosphodiester phosphodiesterase family protein [Phenylobacterium deserti]|uniref:Glycerophosphodiester phosphodiesterase n=1 Tax=Phenylobacterium deserti TaxID=1914756 RepID=A0A328AE35_9CAUL|nr:glycerophosphodiester phosphodiesterase family protein [Phenylobacterium deserti]RAK51018.1 glycerophosphodiester phosphodiesterase [Phenylobacterium deserti]